MLPNLPIIR